MDVLRHQLLVVRCELYVVRARDRALVHVFCQRATASACASVCVCALCVLARPLARALLICMLARPLARALTRPKRAMFMLDDIKLQTNDTYHNTDFFMAQYIHFHLNLQMRLTSLKRMGLQMRRTMGSLILQMPGVLKYKQSHKSKTTMLRVNYTSFGCTGARHAQ